MNKPWPKVRPGDALYRRKEFIQIDDVATYKRPRVKLHAQGIVLRDEIEGVGIKTKSQQVWRAGEFVVAEIDAKVGGFGIVPETLDGSIVSSHYFLFVIDESKLDRRFLDFFIRTPAFHDQVDDRPALGRGHGRQLHIHRFQVSKNVPSLSCIEDEPTRPAGPSGKHKGDGAAKARR